METNYIKEKDNDMERELELLSKELQCSEEELLPQIDGLAKAIPEIYKGYASMVREIVGSTLSLFKSGSRAVSRVAVAAEIGARAIEAFGEYKAAKEHNRLLIRYMEIKYVYATNNLERVATLLPRLKRSNMTSARLFRKCTSLSYDLDRLDQSSIGRVANIQLKALSIHRTNAYLLELCKYLENEYKVWLRREQRSEFDMPDYYMINEILADTLFGRDKLFDAYVAAADIDSGSITGAQIMLLADYQLSMMALGQKFCKINPSKANPLVRKLIEDCGAAEKYKEITATTIEHISFDPSWMWYVAGVLAIGAIIWFVITQIQGHDVGKWIGAAVAIGVVIRLTMGLKRSSNRRYVEKGEEMIAEAERQIEASCGKVERPDIDYNERSALRSAITGFFHS